MSKSIAFLALLFLALASWKLSEPRTYVFDEAHYIPAAKALLTGEKLVNLEHPPLGKELIAMGLLIGGDRPFGWRIMSVLFGALTLIGMMAWARQLFQNQRAVFLTGLFTITNNFLFIQSRIAMLDTFMTAFLVWGACFFTRYRKDRKFFSLILCGLSMGLAAACKWFALIPLFFLFAILVWRREIRKSFILGGVAFMSYAVTFIPYAFFPGESWINFPQWQLRMWTLQKSVPPVHGYGSTWWSWPLMLRPMWYHYENVPGTTIAHGIFLIGNPFVLWGGLIAFLVLLLKTPRTPLTREIGVAFFVAWLGYAVVPRELMFFYYYYPAVLVLGLALTAQVYEKKKLSWISGSISVIFFLYFFPVLAGLSFRSENLKLWTWFRSWI